MPIKDEVEFICKFCGHKKARSPLRACGKCGRFTFEGATRQYRETIERINKQAAEEKEAARVTLRKQLKPLNVQAHEELKAIRVLEQKTLRR